MSTMKIINTSRLLIQNKLTIKEDVLKKLNIKPGDIVAFLKSESGDIIIRNMADVEIKEVN